MTGLFAPCPPPAVRIEAPSHTQVPASHVSLDRSGAASHLTAFDPTTGLYGALLGGLASMAGLDDEGTPAVKPVRDPVGDAGA